MRVNLSKTALGLTAGLLVLSIGGFTAAAAAVNADRDQVALTGQVLAGDPSAAVGLTVESRTTLDHYLFWDTRHTFGEEETDETDFDFASFRRREQSNANTGVDLYTELAMGFSFSSSGRQGIDDQPAPGLIGAYNALYLETPNGETRSMVITLSDYYAYYPITGTIRLPSCTLRLSWEDAHQTVQPDKTRPNTSPGGCRNTSKFPCWKDSRWRFRSEKVPAAIRLAPAAAPLGRIPTPQARKASLPPMPAILRSTR